MTYVSKNHVSETGWQILHGLFAGFHAREEYDIPAEPKYVSVDAKTLDSYTGKYEIKPGMMLTISREGDTLMAELAGEPKVSLGAKSKTTFLAESVRAELTFHDNDGNVEVVVTNHDGEKARAKRKDAAAATPQESEPAVAP